MSIIARSIAFDISTTWGGAYPLLRGIKFSLAGSEEVLTLSDFTAYASSTWAGYNPEAVFVSALEGAFDCSIGRRIWSAADGVVNSRIVIVFNGNVELDLIEVNNGHCSGGDTEFGARAVNITSTLSVMTDAVYNAAVNGGIVIGDTEWPIHTALNEKEWNTVYTEVPSSGIWGDMDLLGTPASSFDALVTVDASRGRKTSQLQFNGDANTSLKGDGTWAAGGGGSSDSWETVPLTALGEWLSVSSINGLFYMSGTIGGPSGGRVATSVDGVNWVEDLSDNYAGYDVHSGGKYISGSHYSFDGLRRAGKLSLPNSPFVTASENLIYSDMAIGNGMIIGVAVKASGWTTAITKSVDNGISWTAHTVPGTGEFDSWYFASFLKGMFIVATRDAVFGTNKIITSPDGETWTNRGTSTYIPDGRAVGNANVVCMPTTDGGVLRSTDGLTWTFVGLPGSPSENGQLAYGNGIFMYVMPTNTYSSTDGLTWTTTARPANGRGMVTFNNGIFVAGGDDYAEVYGSVDVPHTLNYVVPNNQIHLSVRTTNATEATMSVGGDNNGDMRFDINQTVAFIILVSAYNYDDEEGAAYKFSGAVRIDGEENVALVGTVGADMAREETSMTGCAVVVEADDTAKILAVRVTGLAGTTIDWNANVTFCKSGY